MGKTKAGDRMIFEQALEIIITGVASLIVLGMILHSMYETLKIQENMR